MYHRAGPAGLSIRYAGVRLVHVPVRVMRKAEPALSGADAGLLLLPEGGVVADLPLPPVAGVATTPPVGLRCRYARKWTRLYFNCRTESPARRFRLPRRCLQYA